MCNLHVEFNKHLKPRKCLKHLGQLNIVPHTHAQHESCMIKQANLCN